MLAVGLRAIQVILCAACAYLVYGGAHALVSPRTLPDTPLPQPGPAADPQPEFASFQIIAARNLFGSPEAAPPPTPPPVEEEEIEESRLPLRLLGTTASASPQFAVASIEDTKSRERLAVRVGDIVAGAELLRVERRRVVLRIGDKLQQLSIDEEKSATPRRAARGSAERASSNAARARELARRARPRAARSNRRPVTPSASGIAASIQAMMTSSELQLRPGERVQSVNGYRMSEEAELNQLLEDFEGQNTFVVTLVDANGNERKVEWKGP